MGNIRNQDLSDVDLSRFDAAPLIAFTTTKVIDYGIEMGGEFRDCAVRIALTSGLKRALRAALNAEPLVPSLPSKTFANLGAPQPFPCFRRNVAPILNH